MNRRLTMLLLALSVSFTAGAQSMGSNPTITVLPDRYVVASRTYSDLGRLEDAVRALRPAQLTLDACGPRETRALLGAAHRFRDLPIHIRPLSVAEDSACSPPAFTHARVGAGSGPTGIDEQAVSAYWNELAP